MSNVSLPTHTVTNVKISIQGFMKSFLVAAFCGEDCVFIHILTPIGAHRVDAKEKDSKWTLYFIFKSPFREGKL